MGMKSFLLATFSILPLFVIPSIHAQGISFETQIWPILEAKCVECHRAPYEENGRVKKPKGGLRLDGAWAIMLGGDGGAVVDPGHPDKSELLLRTELPEDDDEFMPPTGKADPLTDQEKALLVKWIEGGAEFGGWAGNLKGKPKELSNAGGKIPVSEIQEIYKSLSADLSSLKEDDWKGITDSGGRVMPLGPSSPLLSVDFRLTSEDTTDVEVASVDSVQENVAQLNLSKTRITDDALTSIGNFPRLVHLDLHRTEITDTGLSHLKNLKHLRYLNLYGTKVTNAGLKSLGKMKSLRSVFLWDSDVTREGIKALEKALPDAKINFD